jgi:hypothetical protein
MDSSLSLERLTGEIAASRDLQTTLTRLLPDIVHELSFDNITLVLFEPDGEHMRIRWEANRSAGGAPDGDRVTPRVIRGTPAEYVRGSGNQLKEDDTAQSRFEHHPVRAAGRRSFVLTPLGEQPIPGVIGFSTYEAKKMTGADAAAAQAIAGAIRQALDTGASI